MAGRSSNPDNRTSRSHVDPNGGEVSLDAHQSTQATITRETPDQPPLRRRRTTTPNPIRAVPSNPNEPGSGTGVGAWVS